MPGLGEGLIEKLSAAGVTTVEALADMTPEQLEAIEGIGPKTVEKISLAVNNYFASLEAAEALGRLRQLPEKAKSQAKVRLQPEDGGRAGGAADGPGSGRSCRRAGRLKRRWSPPKLARSRPLPRRRAQRPKKTEARPRLLREQRVSGILARIELTAARLEQIDTVRLI